MPPFGHVGFPPPPIQVQFPPAIASQQPAPDQSMQAAVVMPAQVVSQFQLQQPAAPSETGAGIIAQAQQAAVAGTSQFVLQGTQPIMGSGISSALPTSQFLLQQLPTQPLVGQNIPGANPNARQIPIAIQSTPAESQPSITTRLTSLLPDTRLLILASILVGGITAGALLARR